MQSIWKLQTKLRNYIWSSCISVFLFAQHHRRLGHRHNWNSLSLPGWTLPSTTESYQQGKGALNPKSLQRKTTFKSTFYDHLIYHGLFHNWELAKSPWEEELFGLTCWYNLLKYNNKHFSPSDWKLSQTESCLVFFQMSSSHL